MTAILSPSDVRAEINTALSDVALTEVIAQAQARLEAAIGTLQDSGGTISNTVTIPGESREIWLPQRITSVTSITEDDALLSSDTYRVWGNEGRIQRIDGSHFGEVLVVVYKPQAQISVMKRAVLNLVRIYLDTKALDGESIGGEYSYQAGRPAELRIAEVIRSVSFVTL